MSSLLSNIPKWVNDAPTNEVQFRRAIHCVLEAIARSPKLRQLLCMKGGILMALHYESPRFTTDIDFSTPAPFSDATENETIELISNVLPPIGEALGYDIECRLQGYKVQPGRDKTFITIEMKVGYAEKGTSAHKKLLNGQSPLVISLDYSFRESIPEIEEVDLSEDGTLRVYALSTLVAEKLRSLLQQPIRNRTRRQDVFDLHHLFNSRTELNSPEYRRRVLDDLIIKCEDRNVPLARESMRSPLVQELAQKDYKTLEQDVSGDLPDFNESFDQVVSFYEQLPWPAG